MLTLDQFRARTTFPDEYIDAIERARPGWLAAQIALVSSKVEARLWKRYAIPFVAPVPEVVLGWVTDMVTLRAWLKRGWDPSTPDAEEVRKAAEQAEKDVAEAADGEAGKFELPLRQDSQVNATSRGGPRGYSEASPYVWTSLQRETGRDEDDNRTGTRR